MDLRCPLRDSGVLSQVVDPEDGISPEICKRLAGRKINNRVLDWSTLWRTLFPGDENVPDPGKSFKLTAGHGLIGIMGLACLP